MSHEEPTTFFPQHGSNKINLPAPREKRPMDGAGIFFWGPLWGGAIIAIVVMAVRYLTR